MNELFLALAEERRLQAQRQAAVRMPAASRSPTWSGRLSHWLGQEPKLQPRHR